MVHNRAILAPRERNASNGLWKNILSPKITVNPKDLQSKGKSCRNKNQSATGTH